MSNHATPVKKDLNSRFDNDYFGNSANKTAAKTDASDLSPLQNRSSLSPSRSPQSRHVSPVVQEDTVKLLREYIFLER